jgi:hypothetical protein
LVSELATDQFDNDVDPRRDTRRRFTGDYAVQRRSDHTPELSDDMIETALLSFWWRHHGELGAVRLRIWLEG